MYQTSRSVQITRQQSQQSYRQRLTAVNDSLSESGAKTSSNFSTQSSETKSTLKWVPSHQGIHNNEQADELAKAVCTLLPASPDAQSPLQANLKRRIRNTLNSNLRNTPPIPRSQANTKQFITKATPRKLSYDVTPRPNSIWSCVILQTTCTAGLDVALRGTPTTHPSRLSTTRTLPPPSLRCLSPGKITHNPRGSSERKKDQQHCEIHNPDTKQDKLPAQLGTLKNASVSKNNKNKQHTEINKAIHLFIYSPSIHPPRIRGT
jgi:hypothetical protein